MQVLVLLFDKRVINAKIDLLMNASKLKILLVANFILFSAIQFCSQFCDIVKHSILHPKFMILTPCLAAHTHRPSDLCYVTLTL